MQLATNAKIANLQKFDDYLERTAAMGAQLVISLELALPFYFEEGMKLATNESVAKSVICGPDPAKYSPSIRRYTSAERC